jgi:hypothetical protein
MNIRALILILGVGWNSAALAECDSSPKPVEDQQSISSGTLVLKAAGSYYLIDACVRISRSQFGTIVALGYLNNFSPSTTPTFYSVKATRTLQGNNHPLLSLVRSPSWYLAASQQAGIQEAPEIRGMPYRGTLSQWNQAHANGATPDELRSMAGLPRPWHAYVDAQKSAASTDDIGFWQIDQNELQPSNMVTSYLIRFMPAQSFSLLEFDVYIQPGVDKVELNIASPIDALSQTRTFLIVP